MLIPFNRTEYLSLSTSKICTGALFTLNHGAIGKIIFLVMFGLSLLTMHLIYRIVYYDSLGDVDSELYLTSSLMWLREMAIEVHKVSLDELYEGAEWRLEVAECNMQNNGTDCGIFTLMNIYCIAFSIPHICCDDNATVCRDKIAHDLFHGKINFRLT